jgi:hypothetical protein
MVTYSVVSCAEEHATYNEGWAEDGLDCQATLRCDWANRHALVADILGTPRPWPYGGFVAPPYARSASVVPDETSAAQNGQGFTYTDALVTVNYTSDQEVDLISESLEPVAEFITLDYKRFRWDSANGEPLIEGEAPGKLVKTLKLVRTHYKLEPPIPVTLLSLVGSVNHVQYNSALLGLSFAAETLLYGAPNLTRTITTAGAKAWDLTLTFTYRPTLWNKFWRAKTELYERIYHVYGGLYYMYPLNDFSDFLF